MTLALQKWPKYCVIIVLCIVSYGDQLDGDFVFDDSAAIVNNKQVSLGTDVTWASICSHDYWGTPILSPTSHKSWRPLTTLSFRIEFQHHGKSSSPHWMKLTNLILHILISCYVLEFGNLFIKDHCRTSFLAAMLFSVHPIHVEAVSGIVGRADLLATLISTLAIGIYFKAFIDKNSSIPLAIQQISILFFIGILCKETAVTMLFVCAALDILYNTALISPSPKLQELRQFPWKRIFWLGLYSSIYISGRFWMGTPEFQSEDNPFAVIQDKFLKVTNQIFLHSINAWLLLCPTWLSFDWSMGSVKILSVTTDYRVIGVAIHTMTLLWMTVRVYTMDSKRKRNQLAATLILTLVPFIPASGIIHVGFVIAERLLYMPSIGFSLMIALGFRKLLKSSSSKCVTGLLRVLFILLIFVFVLRTRLRAAEWKKEETLYESARRVCPNNAKVHYNIGIAKRYDPAASIAFYRRAIALYPEYDAALMNLGNVYRDQKDLDQAEYYLRRALSNIKVTDKRAAAEMNLGIVMVMRKRYSEGLQHYNNALQARPYYPVCYYNMGNAYLELKQFDVAQKNFETAITLDRTMHLAWKNLLTLLYNEEKFEETIARADEAFSILPAELELLFPKANALAKLKRNEEAEAVFKHLMEQRPGDAVYPGNLGVLYHHWKRYDQAAIYYRHALALNPQMGRLQSALEKVTKLQMNQMQ